MRRLNFRSVLVILTFSVVFCLAVVNIPNIPQQSHLPVFVALSIIASLIVLSIDLGERVSRIRIIVAIVNMILVTAVYLSYLEREVVLASAIITGVASAVTYYRAIIEYRRRESID